MHIAFKLNVAPWNESKASIPYHDICNSSIKGSIHICKCYWFLAKNDQNQHQKIVFLLLTMWNGKNWSLQIGSPHLVPTLTWCYGHQQQITTTFLLSVSNSWNFACPKLGCLNLFHFCAKPTIPPNFCTCTSLMTMESMGNVQTPFVEHVVNRPQICWYCILDTVVNS